MPEVRLRIDGTVYEVRLHVHRSLISSYTIQYNEKKWFKTVNEYRSDYDTATDAIDDVQSITVGKVEQIDGVEPCEKLSDPDLWKADVDGDPDVSDLMPEKVFKKLVNALVETSEHVELTTA